MDFGVRIGFALLVAACVFEVKSGGATEDYIIHIQSEPNATEITNSKITLSCVVSGKTENVSKVKWYVNNNKNKEKECDVTASSGSTNMTDFSVKVCNLTVRREEEKIVYKCQVFNTFGENKGLDRKAVLVLEGYGSEYAATITLFDGSTGKMVDADAEPMCVPAGATHSFECRIQDKNPRNINPVAWNIHPGPWNITWIFENATNSNNASATNHSFHEDYINVSRSFNVFNPGDKSLHVNLNCHATSREGQSLNATVKLQLCYVPAYHQTLFNFLMGIVTTLVIAFIVATILIFKFDVDRRYGL